MMVTKSLLAKLGEKCLSANFTRVENNGDFAIEADGDSLYLLFQWSSGDVDWKNNFDFPAKPYRDMETSWMCHRGFLRVWKSIEPYIKETVLNPAYKHIYVVGYSHGAAIATLAHEYVWFNRPDIRDTELFGVGFGCPRCYWGFKVKKKLKERWENFYPCRNARDIVTHVPPVAFGFRHVSKLLKVDSGTKGAIKAHYWDEYEKGIENYVDN